MSEENFSPDTLRIFGGLCTFEDRLTLPKGLSPNCADVEFTPGSVRSRDGYGLKLTFESYVDWFKTFVRNGVRKMLLLLKTGELMVEYPEGTCVKLMTNIGSYIDVQGSSETIGERAIVAISQAGVGIVPPIVTDGATVRRFTSSAPPIGVSIASSATAGTIPAGVYWFFCFYKSEAGYLSPASVRTGYTAPGGKKADITDIPLGPPGTVARMFAFGLAGGAPTGPFFYLPGDFDVGNNTTTTLTVNFTAEKLAAGEDASELMEKIVLPPCVGIASYNGRSVAIGVPNFATPALDPTGTIYCSTSILRYVTTQLYSPALGHDLPLGWASAAGIAGTFAVSAIAGQPNYSAAFTSAVGGGADAFETMFGYGNGAAYVRAGVQYRLGVRVKRSSGFAAGTFTAELKLYYGAYPTIAKIDTVSIPGAIGTEWTMLWSTPILAGPAVSERADIFVTLAGMTGSQTLTFGEWFVQLVETGDSNSTAWISDGQNPEDFFLSRSPVQVSPGDGQQIRAAFMQSGNLYLVKDNSMWVTTDNNGPPIKWGKEIISPICGTPSVNGVGTGNKFAIIAGRAGVYRFDGGSPDKLSQEIEPTWRTIDWTQGYRIWVAVDPEKQRVRIGIPTDTTKLYCDKMLELDYVDGWQSGLLSGDGRGRKWSITNLRSYHGDIVERDDLSASFFLAGGRDTTSNLVPNSISFAFTPWVASGGAAPTVTGSQVDPLGGTSASKWATWTSGVMCSYDTTASISDGVYYTINIWIRKSTGTGTVTFTSSNLGTGIQTQVVTVTANWQRFTIFFGPHANTGTYPNLVVRMTSGTTGDYFVFGTQAQTGLGSATNPSYDGGWCLTTSSARPMQLNAAGILATPISGQTYDFDGPITPTYETAPFGLDVAFADFGAAIVRARGAGVMSIYWVRPDGTTVAVNSGHQMPSLQSVPRYDIETRSNEHELSLGLRISTSAKDAWFVIRRIFAMLQPSAKGPRRGKTN